MKVVPFTYHQCLNFSYNNVEVTIPSDLDPFQFCSSLRGTTACQVLINSEAKPLNSSKYVNLAKLTTTFKGSLKLKTKVSMSTPCHKLFTLENYHFLPNHMENHNSCRSNLSSPYKRNPLWISLIEVAYIKNMFMRTHLHGLKIIRHNKNLLLYHHISMGLDSPLCRKGLW